MPPDEKGGGINIAQGFLCNEHMNYKEMSSFLNIKFGLQY